MYSECNGASLTEIATAVQQSAVGSTYPPVGNDSEKRRQH